MVWGSHAERARKQGQVSTYRKLVAERHCHIAEACLLRGFGEYFFSAVVARETSRRLCGGNTHKKMCNVACLRQPQVIQGGWCCGYGSMTISDAWEHLLLLLVVDRSSYYCCIRLVVCCCCTQ